MEKGFVWKSRYSSDEKPDKMGRWARILYYNGILICWVNKCDDPVHGYYHSITDKFPINGNDYPSHTEITKDKTFEQIKQEAEERFKLFLTKVSV